MSVGSHLRAIAVFDFVAGGLIGFEIINDRTSGVAVFVEFQHNAVEDSPAPVAINHHIEGLLAPQDMAPAGLENISRASSRARKDSGRTHACRPVSQYGAHGKTPPTKPLARDPLLPSRGGRNPMACRMPQDLRQRRVKSQSGPANLAAWKIASVATIWICNSSSNPNSLRIAQNPAASSPNSQKAGAHFHS